MADTTEETSAPVAGPVQPEAQAEPFRDPTLLLNWTVALLVLTAVAAFASLILRGFEYRLLAQIAGGAFTTQDELVAAANASDQRVELASGARAVLFLLTCIPFAMWIYRAAKNARAVGAKGMTYSPGWAVGCNFVPLVNLVVPFSAMREIWRASMDPGHWNAQQRSTPLLGCWWALWLLNGFSGWAAQTMLKHPGSIEAAQAGSLVASSQNVVQIALDVVAILLLRRITAAQIWQTKIADVF